VLFKDYLDSDSKCKSIKGIEGRQFMDDNFDFLVDLNGDCIADLVITF